LRGITGPVIGWLCSFFRLRLTKRPSDPSATSQLAHEILSFTGFEPLSSKINPDSASQRTETALGVTVSCEKPLSGAGSILFASRLFATCRTALVEPSGSVGVDAHARLDRQPKDIVGDGPTLAVVGKRRQPS
jgi:hypothetical protein